MKKVLKEMNIYTTKGSISNLSTQHFEFDKKGRIVKFSREYKVGLTNASSVSKYFYLDIFNKQYVFMKKSSEKFWRLFEIITTKNCRNQKEICKKVFNKIDNLRTMKKTISRYDNDGKIINETIYDDNVDYIEIHKYAYDSDGIISRSQDINMDLDKPVEHVIQEYSFKRNQDGNIEKIDKNNNVALVLDNLGEKILIENDDSLKIIYEYDHNGNVIKKMCPSINTIFTYENIYWD